MPAEQLHQRCRILLPRVVGGAGARLDVQQVRRAARPLLHQRPGGGDHQGRAAQVALGVGEAPRRRRGVQRGRPQRDRPGDHVQAVLARGLGQRQHAGPVEGGGDDVHPEVPAEHEPGLAARRARRDGSLVRPAHRHPVGPRPAVRVGGGVAVGDEQQAGAVPGPGRGGVVGVAVGDLERGGQVRRGARRGRGPARRGAGPRHHDGADVEDEQVVAPVAGPAHPVRPVRQGVQQPRRLPAGRSRRALQQRAVGGGAVAPRLGHPGRPRQARRTRRRPHRGTGAQGVLREGGQHHRLAPGGLDEGDLRAAVALAAQERHPRPVGADRGGAVVVPARQPLGTAPGGGHPPQRAHLLVRPQVGRGDRDHRGAAVGQQGRGAAGGQQRDVLGAHPAHATGTAIPAGPRCRARATAPDRRPSRTMSRCPRPRTPA